MEDAGEDTSGHGHKTDSSPRQNSEVQHHDANIQVNQSRTALTTEPEMEYAKEVYADCQEDRLAMSIYAVLGAILATVFAALWVLPPTLNAAFSVIFCFWVLGRHAKIKANKPEGRAAAWFDERTPSPDTGNLPAVYFLYVLGSGGHTSELCQVIKNKVRGQKNLHRRYLVTSGDEYSHHALRKLEDTIHDAYADKSGGTFDVWSIPRARRVHQSFYTSPFTTLHSALHVINVLTREPNDRPEDVYGEAFKYPHVIVTNGPGTGFVVCMVAYLLKIFKIVPENRLKMVYIESWARSHTMSLTGRLFYWTNIADLFLVQQKPLADKYKVCNVDVVTRRRFQGHPQVEVPLPYVSDPKPKAAEE